MLKAKKGERQAARKDRFISLSIIFEVHASSAGDNPTNGSMQTVGVLHHYGSKNI
jgi:hypothetical protein